MSKHKKYNRRHRATSAHQRANDWASRTPASEGGTVVRYGNKADDPEAWSRVWGPQAAIKALGLDKLA